MAYWIAGGVLVIGIIWPTVINLVVFGKLRRPREEKGISLMGVKGATGKAGGEPVATEEDLAKVAAMAEEIEEKIRSDGGEENEEIAVAAAAAPVKRLEGDALDEATSAEMKQESKEFGRDKDDFYPTEVHAKHPHEDGFTIVELLVVIGIIALLLALLLPAVSGFRQRAIEVKCQATLRNMGWAGQLHLNDHKGFLPLAGWQFNPVGGVLNPQ